MRAEKRGWERARERERVRQRDTDFEWERRKEGEREREREREGGGEKQSYHLKIASNFDFMTWTFLPSFWQQVVVTYYCDIFVVKTHKIRQRLWIDQLAFFQTYKNAEKDREDRECNYDVNSDIDYRQSNYVDNVTSH